MVDNNTVLIPFTKVQSLGAVNASSQELLDIPTIKPIEMLILEYNIENTDLLDVDAINEQFSSIILRFDGDEIFKIENYADYVAVYEEHGLTVPQIVVQRDTVTGSVDNLYMRLMIPIRWQKGLSDAVYVELNYNSTVNTSPTRQARIVYVDQPTWTERFTFSKNPKSASSGAVLDFKPASGEILRGIYIYMTDASAVTPSTIRFPLTVYGGLIGLASIEFSHKKDEFYAVMNETEALSMLQLLHPDVYIPSRDIANIQLDLSYPFNYAQGVAGSTDSQPTKKVEGILSLPTQDIVTDNNTLLRINCDTDTNINGSFATGDLVTVVWVYKVPNPTTEAK